MKSAERELKMKNKIIEWIIFSFICGLGALGFGMTVVVYVEQGEKIEELETYAKENERKIAEYEAMYEWLDDYFELLDEINREAIKDGFYYSLDGTKYQTESINNMRLDELIDLIEENVQYEEEIENYELILEALVDFYEHEYEIELNEEEFLSYIMEYYPELYYQLYNLGN